MTDAVTRRVYRTIQEAVMDADMEKESRQPRQSYGPCGRDVPGGVCPGAVLYWPRPLDGDAGNTGPRHRDGDGGPLQLRRGDAIKLSSPLSIRFSSPR